MRKILFIVIAIGVAYNAWIFYSRWSYGHKVKSDQENKELERDKRVSDLVGGDQVKILSFAASKGTLKRGEHTTLCYGVNAAAKVRIEPELPNIYPALSNCVDIAPTQTTTYKIIAEDKAGKSVDAQLQINVRR